jgi:hypothetical protein
MKNRIKHIFFFAVLIFIAGNSFATLRYWIGSGSTSWKTTTNWSPSGLPTTTDTVYFDSGGGNCTLDTNTSVKRFEIKSTYSSTFSQGSYSLTVASGGVSLAAGTFTGGTGTITITNGGNFSNTGCSFTSTSGTFDIQSGDFLLTSSGAFIHNSGLVKLSYNAVGGSDTCHLNLNTSSGNKTFYDLELNSNSTTTSNHIFTFVSTTTITCNNDLNVTGAGQKRIGTGTIAVRGDATISGTGYFIGQGGAGGIGKLKLDGSSAQNLTANSAPTLTNMIALEFASTSTITLSGKILAQYNWTYTSGTLSSGSADVYFINNSQTIAGTFALNNVYFSFDNNNLHITISSGSQLTASANLFFDGAGYGSINTGTIHATGYISQNTTGSTVAGGGTAILKIDGSGNQTFTGRSSSYSACRLPNVEINKSGGTLTLTDKIHCGENWTHTSGTLSSSGGTVGFSGSGTISGSPTLSNVCFTGTGTSTTTIASGSTLTCTGTLSTEGSSSIVLNTGTINAEGDISVTNSSTSGGGSAIIVVTGTVTQNFSGNSTPGTGNLCKLTFAKTGGTVTLSNAISTKNNFTYTASGGTVSVGTSTLAICATSTVTPGALALNNVTFAPTSAATVTIASGNTLTVNGTYATSGTVALTVNGSVSANGDFNLANTSTSGGGTGTITFGGSGNQTINGTTTAGESPMPNIVISKSGGTLFFRNGKSFSVKGNWTYTAGTINTDSGKVVFVAANTISGNDSLHDVSFTGAGTYTIASGSTLTVKGKLSIDGGTNSIVLATGTIAAKGDISITNLSVATATRTATILINGSGTQDFSGSGTSDAGRLCNINISKPSSSVLTLNNYITVEGNFTYVSGTVNANTGNNVYFRGSYNLNGDTMYFNNVFISANSRSLTGKLNTKGDINIATTTTLNNSGNYAIGLGGNWINNGTYTAGTGVLTVNGSGYQSINKASVALETFPSMTVNKSGGSLKLNCPMKITTAMTLTEGKIGCDSIKYLEFADNATCSLGNDSAFVHGFIRKTGNDTFWFPLGDTTLTYGQYHGVRMSAPSTTTDQFEAVYKSTSQPFGTAVDDSLESVSSCEYWTLRRKVGSSDIKVGVNWNTKPCAVNNYDDLVIAAWDATNNKWTDEEQDYLVISSGQGSLRTPGNVTKPYNPLTFTLAHKRNSDPFAILHKKLDGGFHQVTNGKLLFRFEEEYNDVDQTLSFNIYDDLHRLVSSSTIIASLLQVPVQYGDNRYYLNLYDCDTYGATLSNAGYYTLEIINEKNEKWYLQYKHNVTRSSGCTQ